MLNGRIVGLSMGPPFAAAVLKYALSAGADTGVLLTDRKLGGADTAATAYPLAAAIRKIEKNIFRGDKKLAPNQRHAIGRRRHRPGTAAGC